MVLRNCKRLLKNISQLEEIMDDLKEEQSSTGIDWDRLEEDFFRWLNGQRDEDQLN